MKKNSKESPQTITEPEPYPYFVHDIQNIPKTKNQVSAKNLQYLFYSLELHSIKIV